MKIEPFQMERMQSKWEYAVRYNLSESGVQPVPLGELVPDPDEREELFGKGIGYGQSNGTAELRRAIAAMYPGAGEDNVLVTNGASEAIFLILWSLIEPGDEVVMMLPNYMQIWGLARGFGAEVKPFFLVEEKQWAPDLDQFEAAVSPKTKLILVCNPNNPTGAILSGDEMDAITSAARRVGAWIMADEVYRGAEINGELTASFWGQYEKLLVVSGLSKACGLPGLRIGWLVSSPEMAMRAWSYRDYTSICPPILNDLLARVALREDVQQRLLNRTRSILNSNLPILREWIDRQGGRFTLIEPRAGALTYPRYHFELSSLEFMERLRKEKSVLVVPGEHFLMGKYLRIGYGSNPNHLREGLGLIESFISKLQ